MTFMEPYGIALIGCGTVGSGVAQLLLDHSERLAAGWTQLELRRVLIRDETKTRPSSARSISDEQPSRSLRIRTFRSWRRWPAA